MADFRPLDRPIPTRHIPPALTGGDVDPKIFDITGQRERAVNEYTQAQRTRDNTQGAQDEVAKYLRQPYKAPSKEAI